MRQIIGKTWMSALVLLIVTGAGYGIILKHVSVGPDKSIRVSSDVLAFVQAGRDLSAGRDMYHNADGSKNSYVYPPFWAMANILLTGLPPLLVDTGWYVLNVWLILPVLAMSYRLFTGEDFARIPRRQRWAAIALSVFLSFRYLLRNAQDANINMVILFFVVAGTYLCERYQRPAGAGLIGIAAAIKVLPLVFAVRFAAMRKWKELVWLAAGFAVASLLPALLTGLSGFAGAIASFLAYSRSQFGPAGIEVENFSIWGTLGRICSQAKAFEFPDGHPVTLNILALDPAVLKAVTVALSLAILFVVWAVSRNEENRGGPSREDVRNASFAITLLAMNLVSILTEDHHLVGLMAVYLYLMVCWQRGALGGKTEKFLIAGGGLFSLMISYDAIVPLFGKFAYMVMLGLSLPVLPVEITLFAIVLRLTTAPRASHIS
jgi:hypothetical protein